MRVRDGILRVVIVATLRRLEVGAAVTGAGVIGAPVTGATGAAVTGADVIGAVVIGEEVTGDSVVRTDGMLEGRANGNIDSEGLSEGILDGLPVVGSTADRKN
jgi:hypothetical protein